MSPTPATDPIAPPNQALQPAPAAPVPLVVPPLPPAQTIEPVAPALVETASLRLQRRVGLTLVSTGAGGFVAGAVLHELAARAPNDGELPATSLFLILIGMVFFFPSLLRDGNSSDSGVSTMRVVVLLLISVFALFAIRNGWGNSGFQLDQNWIWIVALAVGGKAGQRAVEQLAPGAGAQDKK